MEFLYKCPRTWLLCLQSHWQGIWNVQESLYRLHLQTLERHAQCTIWLLLYYNHLITNARNTWVFRINASNKQGVFPQIIGNEKKGVPFSDNINLNNIRCTVKSRLHLPALCSISWSTKLPSNPPQNLNGM